MSKALGGAAAAALIFCAGFFWPRAPVRQLEIRYDTLRIQVTHYDTVTRWRLRVDTARAETVTVYRDTARAMIVAAESLPDSAARPVLVAACNLLDSALSVCERRVTFWQAHADTLRGQRDDAMRLANDAVRATRREPGWLRWAERGLFFLGGVCAAKC